MVRIAVTGIVMAFVVIVGMSAALAALDTSGESSGEAGTPSFLDDEYPPGIAKHLEKHGALPPGLQKKLDLDWVPPGQAKKDGEWSPPGEAKGDGWVPPGHARKGTLPPGLEEQEKTPPGWANSG